MSPAPCSTVFPFRLAILVTLLGCTAMLRAQGERRDGGEAFPPPDRGLIFFPPFPPPLDAAMPSVSAAAIHPSAPGELADHVGEIFYPQLSARLHGKKLSDRHRQQLASYRASKQALQQEIRLALATTREAEPAVRHRELQALARRQAAKLAALEQTAEQLRNELIAADLHWNAFRQWRLTDRERRGFSPLEIAQVMRACAFYEKGLLSAQRVFLREIAQELLLAAENTHAAAAAQPHVFFSPSPARVPWPDDAPVGVATKLAAYQTKKAALKKELYDTLSRHDADSLRLFAKPLAELATKQAARVAELEILAEEIRLDLAALGPPAVALPHSPVPPRLTEQAGALNHRRTLLKKEATLQLEAIAARSSDEQLNLFITFRFETDGLKFVVIPRASGPGELAPRVQAVGAEVSAVADEYGRELVSIANAEEELRREIGLAIGDRKAPAIDQAFEAAVRAVDAQQNATAYAEYRAAVFEPGLSPEQRRVLFDGAIEQLDLPLPRGELQPWRRRDSW